MNEQRNGSMVGKEGGDVLAAVTRAWPLGSEEFDSSSASLDKSLNALRPILLSCKVEIIMIFLGML